MPCHRSKLLFHGKRRETLNRLTCIRPILAPKRIPPPRPPLAPQCGDCQPGVSARRLCSIRTAVSSDAEIDTDNENGNICRCEAYRRMKSSNPRSGRGAIHEFSRTNLSRRGFSHQLGVFVLGIVLRSRPKLPSLHLTLKAPFSPNAFASKR